MRQRRVGGCDSKEVCFSRAGRKKKEMKKKNPTRFAAKFKNTHNKGFGQPTHFKVDTRFYYIFLLANLVCQIKLHPSSDSTFCFCNTRKSDKFGLSCIEFTTRAGSKVFKKLLAKRKQVQRWDQLAPVWVLFGVNNEDLPSFDDVKLKVQAVHSFKSGW